MQWLRRNAPWLALPAIVVVAMLVFQMAADRSRSSQPAACKETDTLVCNEDDLESAAIYVGLKQVDKLRQWQLCSAELNAMARSLEAEAADFLREESGEGKEPPADVKEEARWFQQDAARYRRAANLAKSARVPCFPAGKPSYQPNFASVMVTLQKDGRREQRNVRLADAAVLQDYLNPVEYSRADGICSKQLRGQAQREMWLQQGSTWGGADETEEANMAAAILREQANMLDAAGVKCPKR